MAGESVRAVLNHVWSALDPLPYPCALIGGIALAVWNHPRATRDVDLLIGVDSTQLDRVIERLAASDCRPKKMPPLITVGSHHFAQFLYTPQGEFYDVQFDLLFAESDLQRSAIARRVARKVPGVDSTIDVLACEDLVLFKLLAGRMIDRADAAMLIRENCESIDFEYLTMWIAKLDLTSEFEMVWNEANPGKDIPNVGG